MKPQANNSKTIKTYKAYEAITIPLSGGGYISLNKKDFDENAENKFICINDSLKQNKDNLIEALTLRIKACEASLLKALDRETILSIDSQAIMYNKPDKTWGFVIGSHIRMLNLLEKIKNDISYLCICTGPEAYQMMKAICYHHKNYPEELLTLFLMKIQEGK